MTEDERKKAALDIRTAAETKKPIPPFSKSFTAISNEDGYQIQRHWVDLRLEQGANLAGYKIGLTSRAMQVTSNATEPDYGHLLDDMIFEDGTSFGTGRFIKPRVEVELAFVLGRDLAGPGARVSDVLRATEFVTPAMEIADFRTELPRQLPDTIADNAAAAAMVMGGQMVRPADVDLRWVGASLSQNAVIEETGLSCAVMGHPARAVAWLANKLGVHGASLKAGQVILAGSLVRALPAAPGDVFTASFGPLGNLAVSF